MATNRRLIATTTKLILTTRLLAVPLLCSLVALVALQSPAHAQESYKFWGYYHHTDGSWVFAQSAPSEVTPEDGALEGWRFAVTPPNGQRPPRSGDLAFADVCGDTEAGGAQKRVAILIDYGTRRDAPQGDQPPGPVGECAVVPQDATSEQALQSVADVRIQDGLTCGINGYPSASCSQTVADAQPPTQEATVDFALPASEQEDAAATNADAAETADDGGGAPWALIAIAALVVVLAGGAFLITRRRA